MLLQHLKGCITYFNSTVNAITLAVIVLPLLLRCFGFRFRKVC